MSTFRPTEASRALLHELHGHLGEVAEQKFFDIWESEMADPMAPRLAGSIVANSYMRLAARFAVFGCQCANREPSLELWMALAKQQFEDAVRDCSDAQEKSALTSALREGE